MTQSQQAQSAHAVLTLNDNYVLQLRDDKPTIWLPGKWALFGGKMKPGEEPLTAIKRELYEELSIKPAEYSYLWYEDYFLPREGIDGRIWFFASDVTTVWNSHKLREGKAVKVFRFQQLATLDIPKVIYQTLERFHRQREKFVNKK